jgi:AraC-like DNA-binding protein
MYGAKDNYVQIQPLAATAAERGDQKPHYTGSKTLFGTYFPHSKGIVYDLGYNDPAYFSRLFQTKTVESPSGFRANFLA